MSAGAHIQPASSERHAAPGSACMDDERPQWRHVNGTMASGSKRVPGRPNTDGVTPKRTAPDAHKSSGAVVRSWIDRVDQCE